MKKTLITHLYYGDPSEDFSLQLAQTLVKSGADILEIGIPYSDPMCDGEVFQRSCSRALEHGMTPQKVFLGIQKLRNMGIKNPIYVTSYYGPICKMGEEVFVRYLAGIGVQGMIVPDILLEEQDALLQLGKKYYIAMIQFATPYSTEERLQKIIFAAQDFIYCVSNPGVTGVREDIEMQTVVMIQRVKKVMQRMNKILPIYIGFGISKPEHVNLVVNGGVDGVIVGSAIGKLYENNFSHKERALKNVKTLVRELKKAL